MSTPRAGLVSGFLFAVLAGGATAAEPPPCLRLHIKPSQVDAAKGTALVEVVTTVEGMKVAAGQPLLTHQNGAPGMVGGIAPLDLAVTDDLGPVPVALSPGTGLATWTASREVRGLVTVRYRQPLDNGHKGMLASIPCVDEVGVCGIMSMLFLMPRTTGRYRIAVDWDLSAMPPGSTALSSFGEGQVTSRPITLSAFRNAMFMAGQLQREPDPPGGRFAAAWLGRPAFDMRAGMRWSSKLNQYMSGFFADPSPSYVFTHAFTHSNGVAAPHTFVFGYTRDTTVDGMKSLLGHEMVHTFTTGGVEAKWYTEGLAVYYQVQLPWRAGLVPIEARLADLNLTAARYFTNDMINAPDSAIDEASFWSDMRFSVLAYDRGAIYFAVLDGMIRRASQGKRSVDDLVRAMSALVLADQPATEATWVDLLRKELGEAGPALHRAMLEGRRLVPESGDYGPEFRRVSVKIPRFDLGFGPQEVKRHKVVKNLRPDSNAAKAGLKEGDAIQYTTSTDSHLRDPNMVLTLQVTRDGRTFPITYLPRGELREAYQWERVPGSSGTPGTRSH